MIDEMLYAEMEDECEGPCLLQLRRSGWRLLRQEMGGGGRKRE